MCAPLTPGGRSHSTFIRPLDQAAIACAFRRADHAGGEARRWRPAMPAVRRQVFYDQRRRDVARRGFLCFTIPLCVNYHSKYDSSIRHAPATSWPVP